MSISNKSETSKNLSMKSPAIQLSAASWSRKGLGVLAITLAFILSQAEGKRSACWRYGHVCWGGHGKRSGNGLINIQPISNDVTDELGPIVREDSSGGFSQMQIPPQALSHGLFQAPPRFLKQPLFYPRSDQIPPFQNMFHLSRFPPRFEGAPVSFRGQDVNQQRQLSDGESDSGGSMDDRGLPNDSIIVPEYMPISAKSTLPAFKRNDEDGNSPAGGTEEPLETSSNGLDSGSVATFFRDRKASEKQVASSNSEAADRSEHKYSHDYPRGHVKLNEVYKLMPLTRSRPMGVHYMNARMFS